ncbi:mg2+ transporter zinc transport protein [Diplodia corticola]|uniref:Mg2+ transporter zinc transport protein n=1 Tax=Diplodia corticola TaxID=236234 RepID=A0A1J9QRI9_9PEZI|nr:mg2+ transporter zinc transport protein [Diplodia corticola]OJD30626.1 mg2+ transporter zinc transport protein [Diplodia corticola]
MANNHVPLAKWTWKTGTPSATRSATTLSEFLQQPDAWTGRLRVLSIPRDTGTPDIQPLLNSYLSRLHVPDEFLLERDQAVNHGFGTIADYGRQRHATWMRLVAKGISVERDPHGNPIAIDTPVVSNAESRDRAWFSFAFVLLEETNGTDKQATLLCFDAPTQLHKDLNDLDVSDEQLNDAYFVFAIVLKAVWKTMDDDSWTLADVFRNIEKSTLERSASDKSVSQLVNFSELHNISKHQIYMSEAFEAAQLVANDLLQTYRDRFAATPPQDARLTEQKLLHSARMFKASHLRLNSLEKRISNITSLAFNIVTQEDSRSMHTIALITLVFLPSTLIATVFSSSFFDFTMADDDNNETGVHLSSLFWIFWVISIPITLVVVCLWWSLKWCSNRKKKKKRPFSTA